MESFLQQLSKRSRGLASELLRGLSTLREFCRSLMSARDLRFENVNVGSSARVVGVSVAWLLCGLCRLRMRRRPLFASVEATELCRGFAHRRLPPARQEYLPFSRRRVSEGRAQEATSLVKIPLPMSDPSVNNHVCLGRG